jgi:outer membrane protein
MDSHESFRTRLAAGAGVLFSALTLANAVETRPVSLEDCVGMALQRNLDIRVSYYNPRLALSQLQQQYGAWDPSGRFSANQNFNASPTLALPGQPVFPGAERWRETYSAGISGQAPLGTTYDLTFNVPRNSDAQQPQAAFIYTPSMNLNLTQPLLRNFWIDQPRMMIAVNKIGVKRSEQDVREVVMTVATQVALAYHDVIAARENVRVQRKAVETAERRLAEQKKRVEVGALAPLDEKQSESEVFRVRADLLRAEGVYGDAHTRLQNLISDDIAGLGDSLFDPTLTLSAVPAAFDKQDSWHKGLTQRPDLARANFNLEQQRIRRKFTFNQLFPQLDLSGSYGVSSVGVSSSSALDQVVERTFPNHAAGITLTIPFSNRNAREAHRQVKLEQERLLLDYKRLEQVAMRDIDISIRAARTQLERVGATKKQREFAAQALDAEEKKLANGKSTAFEVLRLQRDLTQAEADEINAMSEYNKELYRLSQAEGDTLNKLGIVLEIK